MKVSCVAAVWLLSAAALSSATWAPINTGLPHSFFGIATLTVDPSKPSTLYAITTDGGLFKSTDAAASWTPVFGMVGLSALVLDPTNSSTIYAATQHGIVKSIDGGATWNSANGDLAENCFLLAIDPTAASTLYALSYGLIFKTTNGGETWKQIYGFPGPTSALSLVIDANTPATLYAVTNTGAILTSTDGGENWLTIRSGFPGGGQGIPRNSTPLAIQPQVPSTLYAGSFAAAHTNTAAGVPPIDFGAGTISSSTDGGQTWTIVRAGVPSDAYVTSLAFAPGSPATIYASYRQSGSVGGILKSTDGGASWSMISTGLAPVGSITVDPRTPSTVYAAYSDFSATPAISKSSDAGSSWSPANQGLEYWDLHVIAAHPLRPATIYTGGASGVFRNDAGADWVKLAALQFAPSNFFPQPAPAAVRSLLIDGKNPNVLYAETVRANACAFYDKTVFKSTDGGITWNDSVSPLNSGCVLGGLGASLMAMDPVDPETLYLGEADDLDDYYELLKSTDGGASWTDIWDYSGLQFRLNTLVIDPVTPTTLYAGAGTGVFKSTDGGAHWNATSVDDTAVTALAIDPANPGILYASTQGIYTKPYGFRGLFKSKDSGVSWAAMNSGLSGLGGTGATITSLSIDPNDSNVVYAATSGDGVYQSTDGGGNWARLNDGLTNLHIRALAIVPGTPATLYAATPGGVFKAVRELE